MQLALLAGNNRQVSNAPVARFVTHLADSLIFITRGDIALISAGSDRSEWILEGRWTCGHEGVVRSVLLLDEWVSHSSVRHRRVLTRMLMGNW